MEKTYSGQLKKSGDKLVYIKTGHEVKFKQFIKSLKEGDSVDVFMEIADGTGTLAQLAKLHKSIRVLSNRAGENFEAMKLFIKDQSGLVIRRTALGKEYFEYKSFGDCSADDLNLAIQACIDIGEDQFGINLS